MLDIESFSFLNGALENNVASLVIMASNRDVFKGQLSTAIMDYLWIFSIISSLSAQNRTAKNISNKSSSQNNPATSRPTTPNNATGHICDTSRSSQAPPGQALLLFSSQDSSSPLAPLVLSKISMKKIPRSTSPHVECIKKSNTLFEWP